MTAISDPAPAARALGSAAPLVSSVVADARHGEQPPRMLDRERRADR